MATEVTLPALGESVTEGTVTSWLKSVGDEVAVDEPLLEVSTDKVDTEIPSPAAGTLLEIKAQEDDTVEVGAVLAVIGAADDSTGTSSDGAAASAAGAEAEAEPASAAGAEAEAERASASTTDGAGDEGADSAESGGDAAASAGDATQESSPGAAPSTPETDEGAADAAPSEQGPAARADVQPADSGDDSGGDSGGGDASEVTLPALGESVTEGTVTSWLKSVGDEVAVDEPLLEVSTDKVDTEIPSPVAGKLLEIRVAEDETVEVGAVLAVIGSGSAAPASSTAPGSSDTSADSAAPPDSGGPGRQASGDGAQTADEPVARLTADAETGDDQPESAADVAPGAPPSPDVREKVGPDAPAASAASADIQAEPQPQAEALPSPQTTPEAQGPATQEAPSQPAASSDGAGGSGDSGDSGGDKTYVTPLVRKLAAQHNVDLARLSGSGVGGRIRKQDVLAAAEKVKESVSAPAASTPSESARPSVSTAEPSPLRGTTEKLSRLRKVIAARMVESLQTSAQLTTVVEVDVTAISRLRERVKSGFEQREGVKLSFLPFFAKAAVDALKTYPQVNASIDTEAGEVTYHDGEHLGVAVDTERGLLVPVIKDAGDLSIAGLARKIADLAARTRDNKVTPDELSGGTFTLTNTGSRGALFDTPIINQPQVGILGTGTVVKRPVVIDDPNLGETIAVRQMVYLALTYDHRLVDGADAARFLTAIKHRLEEANFESELGV